MADYLVWCPEEGETAANAEECLGYSSAEEAAEDWARGDDWREGDYGIANGRREATVLVRPLDPPTWVDGSDEPLRLQVTGETTYTYTAQRCEGGDDA